MQLNSDPGYKSFFWKRFFPLFIPILIIGVISEPYISQNPFRSLEDYGEFIFFLLFYTLVLFGWAAFIISMTWRVKQSRK
ncbi:ABC-type transport system involved in cytochrome c biogenesis permease component [Sporosarcina luteola]|nr:ABC-type transport system involved in cytochrome c biogenesis permease component [Sporosarcina luteola]